MRLSDFDVLSFDCYGTLIDWESGIHAALAPLRARAAREGATVSQGDTPRAGGAMSRDAALRAFARLESRQQEATPELPYPDVLAEVHGRIATEWGVARDPAEDAAFGASVGDWPAFPDTVAALRYLKQHFRLVVLSNVDRASFQATSERLGVPFDAVYTAQDIGSYKPDRRNFAYLVDRLRDQGIPKRKILHVAQSLFHDHVPAGETGLASAWIDRRGDGSGGATPSVSVPAHYDFRFASLGELADAHRGE